MNRIITNLLACLLCAIIAAGCTTVRQSFPDQDPEHVWTALVAVAGTPDYSDEDSTKRWFVKANHIMVDEANRRIEIYRELRRVLHRTTTNPIREERTWRFQVLYDPADPPSASFTARGWSIPTRVHAEADRYFADVWAMLEGPEPIEQREELEQEPVKSAPEPQEPEKPIVDIDELEPTGG